MNRLPGFSLPALLAPASVAALCIALALGGPEIHDLLRYERTAVSSGEAWRLFTGHVVHLGWSHLWLNIAGLALFWVLIGGAFNATGWSAVFLISSLGTSGALYLFNPGLDWYVGLSGVLHGLLLAGVLAMWSDYRDARWLLGLVAVKLAWEQMMGPMPGSEATAGGPVVVDAHLYGAVSGLLAALFLRYFKRFSTKAAA